MSNISPESQEILRKAGVELRDGLIILTPDCLVDKRGVTIRSAKVFFPFDEHSDSGQYKLQNGLWDKFNGLRSNASRSFAVRVNLAKPLPPPSGFVKLGALMYGAKFDKAALDGAREGKALVHFDELAGDYPHKATMGIFPRKEDDVVVIYLEALAPPNGERIQTEFLHAEYRRGSGMFSHVDGALKLYSRKAYESRYTANPTVAPHSDLAYEKIFRIDGPIPFEAWLDLVPAFFPSNRLIREVLETARPA